MPKIHRERQPGFERLAKLPPRSGGALNEREEGLVGHVDEEGFPIASPSRYAAVPAA